MKCEVCGSEYRKIDLLLICANGHTLQNTTEVAHDDIPITGRSKKIYRTKKEKIKYKDDGCKIMKMVLLRMLFDEARVFFDIKDDCIFKYFTEFFEFKNAKLDTIFDVSITTLAIIIYVSKRTELEKNGEIYLWNDFKATFNKFDTFNRLIYIKNKYPSLEIATNEFLLLKKILTTYITLKRWIDDFTSPYSYPKIIENTLRISDNGIYEESFENAKFNIRRLFRNDLEIMKIYFKTICDKLNIEISSDLEFYFDKFIYTFDPDTVIVPEYDMPMFIVAYFSFKGNFYGSDLEFRILDHFRICRASLIKKHSFKIVDKLDMAITPEIFIKSLVKKKRAKFSGLRGSIEFINAFKRLVAENMQDVLVPRDMYVDLMETAIDEYDVSGLVNNSDEYCI